MTDDGRRILLAKMTSAQVRTELRRGRSTGGIWSTPTVHSPSDGAAASPRVAVPDRGEAVAVWQRNVLGGHALIEAAVTESLSAKRFRCATPLPAGAAPPRAGREFTQQRP